MKKPTPKQRLVLEYLLERPEHRLVRGCHVWLAGPTPFCGLTVNAMIRNGWLHDGGPLEGQALVEDLWMRAKRPVELSITVHGRLAMYGKVQAQ